MKPSNQYAIANIPYAIACGAKLFAQSRITQPQKRLIHIQRPVCGVLHIVMIWYVSSALSAVTQSQVPAPRKPSQTSTVLLPPISTHAWHPHFFGFTSRLGVVVVSGLSVVVVCSLGVVVGCSLGVVVVSRLGVVVISGLSLVVVCSLGVVVGCSLGVVVVSSLGVVVISGLGVVASPQPVSTVAAKAATAATATVENIFVDGRSCLCRKILSQVVISG